MSGRPIARFADEDLARPAWASTACTSDASLGVAAGSRRWPPWAAPLGRRLGLQPGAVMDGPADRIPALLGLPVSPRRFVNALLPRGIEDVLWGRR